MLQKFLNFIYHESNLIQNIIIQIINQSRKQNLYKSLNLKDTFQNRLNFQILHFALILMNIKTYKKNKRFEEKIFKAFLYNFDLEFREKGLGDKIIEMKVFEISNLMNYQIFQYKKSLTNRTLLISILKDHFTFNKLNNKIILLEYYFHKQNNHLQSVNFDKIQINKIFLD